MSTPVIKDANTYQVANQLKTADETGREQVQKLNQDWNRMLVSYFSYFSDNLLLIDGFAVADKFQVGDKVHIRQAGVDKYFYVVLTDEDTNVLYVNGGSDYTFTNDDFDIFEFSRIANPYGHPIKFAFSPEPFEFDAAVSFSATEILTYYSMVGPLVTYFGTINFDIASGTPQVIRLKYPFILRNATVPYARNAAYVGNANEAIVVGGSSHDTDQMAITAVPNFVVGNSQTLAFTLILPY